MIATSFAFETICGRPKVASYHILYEKSKLNHVLMLDIVLSRTEDEG